ncbi:MAG: endonuclease/exonuclease/phosphatase family protein [Cyanobacteria bacterium SZAS TMP-1]|nr:endonuclease/exonuclease/phosphatase family protein [Cyanobacteria bacterium SZAS TMP-1]
MPFTFPHPAAVIPLKGWKNTLLRSIGQILFAVVASVSVFLVALTMLTLFGVSCREFELLTHLRVQLLLALTVTIPVWLVMRSKIILALAVAGVIVHLFDILPLYFPHPAKSTVAIVRLLTLNVNRWNKNYAGVQKLIEDEGADIVCLQELAPEMNDSLKAKLHGYPYTFTDARDGYFGIGIFSKYELADQQLLKLCPDDIPTLCATIDVHGTKIRLVNTHPIAPLNAVFYDWRNEQLDALADLTSRSDMPVILAGDLNASCFSPFFKRLLKRGQLSDSESGFGVQPSWSAQSWPLQASFDCALFRLPLDHVLTKGPLVTVDRRLLKEIGSDHLPVAVKLGVTASGAAR